MSDARTHAHELIERLPPNQLTAVVGLLESMLDQVSRAIAQAPVEDESLSDEECQALARSDAWFEERGGKGIRLVFSQTSDTLRIHSVRHRKEAYR